MNNELHISIVQHHIEWDNPLGNLDNITGILKEAKDSDIIVLPEMFATGFIAQRLPQKEHAALILDWMKKTAREKHASIAGSVATPENGNWFNRLYLVTPDGTIQYYDKRHLFPASPEPTYFTRGKQPTIFQHLGWNINPQICYDLRFPIWSRNAFSEGKFNYDILLYVANWPASRASNWNTLLQARAIENQAYVVAANCIGKDPLGHLYQGDSQCISPDGTILAQETDKEQILNITLSKEKLEDFRSRFPVAKDWERGGANQV